MEDKDHHRKQKSTREVDRFSKFMFGNRQPRGTSQTEEDSTSRTKRNDGWFWGRGIRENRTHNHDHQPQTMQNKVENIMNNVDIELLFETFETIKATTEQYKPLLKEITPYFSKFTSKFKK
ncbi:hypothetical protein [Neobacillus drentensis]|uniref:hypothetical protein n=1 Tax=Neobacillus drentensis TaxID=220684 RepID=UPI002FFDDF37